MPRVSQRAATAIDAAPAAIAIDRKEGEP